MKMFKALLLLALTTVACTSELGDSRNGTDEDSLGTATQALGCAPDIHRVTLNTGVTLSYLEQGDRDGEPVIFLHGYSDSHHSFDLNLPLLPSRYHVYALDQRGHGDSSKPACCYTQADFAGDVIAFMDKLGIHKASLVGHSMGSLIAHKVAVNAPNRIKKLVLVGSGPTLVGNPGALSFAPDVEALTDPVDPDFVYAFQSSTFYRPIPSSYLDTAVSESLKLPATVWQQALNGMLVEDHTSDLHRIKAKTLIVWGDQDVFFDAAAEQTLDTQIPHSKLVVYPQTGHGLHAEQPAKFVKDLKNFLD
ncbi:Hydrolase, alpha/beta fold family [Labilithrix luteola]|uniref:Hydrolase, alpha/beta fold family n=1 Tax=Labilithrix luteola TaxID=1391654 RepID=A0A0K1PY85_9BACT|nr:alpha/beta hydrolase [Labilithrix luteola]AKU98336.1 Hydrolase, alpha/beta fold family [Labilithrix luteola]